MKSEHKISILFSKFKILFDKNFEWMMNNTKTNWKLPKTLVSNINLISGYDDDSTYFRYPTTKNPLKDIKKDHSFVSNSNELIKKSSGKKLRIAMMYNDLGEVTNLFEFGNIYEEKLIVALEAVSELFSSMQIAIRMELFNGS